MVNAVDFVTAWVTSQTIDEVMAKTGMSRPAASHRATLMRRRGVRLDLKARGPRVVNVAALNALIDDLARQEAPK